MKSIIVLYNTLFLSHLNYYSNIWGNTLRSSLKNILILQKKDQENVLVIIILCININILFIILLILTILYNE